MAGTIGGWTIKPPFANYPHAKLERLVREGFEIVERNAASGHGKGNWGEHAGTPLNLFDFQVLVAADYYLRSTRDNPGE